MQNVVQGASSSKIYNFSHFEGCTVFDSRIHHKRKKNKVDAVTDGTLNDGVVVLQELEFAVSSQCIQISKDGHFIAVTGIYPPEVRVYDVDSLGLKFFRGLDFEVIDLQFLSEDYRKIIFLQTDRYVELHAQGGRHHRLRIPYEGTSMAYLPSLATACISSVSDNVFLLDLEEGRFLQPWKLTSSRGCCCFSNSVLPLVAVGGNGGRIECFDHRVGSKVAELVVNHGNNNPDLEITTGAFSPTSLEMCVGTNEGSCFIYDLRSSVPVCHHSHRNFESIKKVQWIEGLGMVENGYSQSPAFSYGVASCDSTSIHIWNQQTKVNGNKDNIASSNVFASIEASMVRNVESVSGTGSKSRSFGGCKERAIRFNSFAFYPKSGLCFAPCEHQHVGVFFLPFLGLAPKWCGFLDSFTEILDDSFSAENDSGEKGLVNTIYKDYQFLTQQQLEQLGVEKLIGTALVKRYMHGYFMDAKLYRQLKSATNPFAYEEYCQEKIQRNIGAKKKMRIEVRNKLPKVNVELAQKLQSTLEESDKTTSSKVKREKAAAQQLLTDSRFEKIFSNPDFQIAENI